jgi:hypothetical protein
MKRQRIVSNQGLKCTVVMINERRLAPIPHDITMQPADTESVLVEPTMQPYELAGASAGDLKMIKIAVIV